MAAEAAAAASTPTARSIPTAPKSKSAARPPCLREISAARPRRQCARRPGHGRELSSACGALLPHHGGGTGPAGPIPAANSRPTAPTIPAAERGWRSALRPAAAQPPQTSGPSFSLAEGGRTKTKATTPRRTDFAPIWPECRQARYGTLFFRQAIRPRSKLPGSVPLQPGSRLPYLPGTVAP